MIKNIFRLTALGYIWNRYKTAIISTAALFAHFWLVGAMHEDFVAFIGLNNYTEHLGLSFLVKWVAFILGFVVYLAVNGRKGKIKPVDGSSGDSSGLVAAKDGQDPFDTIRKKDKLRSAADFVVGKKK